MRWIDARHVKFTLAGSLVYARSGCGMLTFNHEAHDDGRAWFLTVRYCGVVKNKNSYLFDPSFGYYCTWEVALAPHEDGGNHEVE